MRNVYVVTHAESQHHLDGVVGGWFDSELSEHGHRQAVAIAEELRARIPVDGEAQVATSDLRRAVQTAGPIAEALGVDVREVAGLRELSYGVAGGRPQAWLDERFIPTPLDDRLDHDCGIEGAETKRQLATRVHAAVDDILRDGVEHQVVVTHGFALTFVVTAWLRIPVEHTGWANFRAVPGGITHLTEDDVHHNRNVRSLSSTAHLDA